MKKLLKYLLIVILLFIPFMQVINVKADSGWDSSYDSGGSWSSSSDWGSSSDWSSSSSYDYDYDYSYGSSSGSGGYSSNGDELITAFVFLIILFIILFMYYAPKSYTPSSNNTQAPSAYFDVPLEVLKKYLPNYTHDSLKAELLQKFIDIQMAWMNFEYDKLKELCTDELFNTYKSQLETLSIKKGKNIMTNFKPSYQAISDIKEYDDTIIVYYNLRISFYDYVIDTESNAVIRGTDTNKVNNNYIMEFVINKNSKLDKCPSCGADISEIVNNKCPYCRTHINKDNKDFVLSRKTNINN